MKKSIVAVAQIALLVLAGCVRSLEPAYREANVVFDAALLGEWVADGSDTWKITRGRGKAYTVEHADEDGRAGTFAGHLFRLDRSLFVDLVPNEADLRVSGLYRDHLVRTHTFYLVVRTEPTPQFASLNNDWLKAHLAKNPAALRHERIGDDVLITAPTGELQLFLVRHVNTKGAFDPGKPWSRQTEFGP